MKEKLMAMLDERKDEMIQIYRYLHDWIPLDFTCIKCKSIYKAR